METLSVLIVGRGGGLTSRDDLWVAIFFRKLSSISLEICSLLAWRCWFCAVIPSDPRRLLTWSSMQIMALQLLSSFWLTSLETNSESSVPNTNNPKTSEEFFGKMCILQTKAHHCILFCKHTRKVTRCGLPVFFSLSIWSEKLFDDKEIAIHPSLGINNGL